MKKKTERKINYERKAGRKIDDDLANEMLDFTEKNLADLVNDKNISLHHFENELLLKLRSLGGRLMKRFVENHEGGNEGKTVKKTAKSIKDTAKRGDTVRPSSAGLKS